MTKLERGDAAPEFQLLDQNSVNISLRDYRGQKVLVYFYPKADTSGCTKQACTVRDAMPELKDLGIAVVGISPDKPDKQKKFDQKYSLGFPLLSDQDHAVAKAYGAWGEKKMYGKVYEGIIRSSFLINEEGKILDAWYKIAPADTVQNVRKALGID